MSVLLDDLKNKIAKGQTIVIVGAGVSIGATKGQKCASWTGLLHDGVDRCVELGRLQATLASLLREQINSGELDMLLSAAEVISGRLGAPNDGEYRRWLRESVGELSVENEDVLAALSELGAVLATTNYDGLIEKVTGLQAITWLDGSQVERVLRGDEKGVLHLHGYWERPESVILGIRSYEQVLGNDHAQTMQRAFTALKTIMFVGCGDGLNDPNFGSLLEWTGKVFAGSEYRRFRLALESEREEIQKLHPPEQRLFVLSYGQKHDDLAGFLRGLKPEEETAKPPEEPPLPPPVYRLPARPRCFGREDDLKAMVAELLDDQPQPIPILGPAGIGKSTLTLAAMHDEQVAAKYGIRRFFIRCDGIKTRGSLAGEIARVIGLEPGPNSENAVLYDLSTTPTILALDNAETPWEADMLPVEELLENLASVPKLALIVSIRGNERPDRVQWREAFRLEELELSAARQTFLAIAGRSFETDSRLNELLAAIDYVPLAIMLIAHASEGEPNLETVWQRWQTERTEMLKRGIAADKSTNIQISYEFSLKSPRLTPKAFRLLKLLAILPSGLAAKDLSIVMYRDGPAAAAVLRKLGLIYDESDRLRLLAPLREYVRAKYQPESFAQQRFASHFITMVETLGGKIFEDGGAEAIQQLTPEAFNIEEILFWELKEKTPKRAIEAIITWSEFAQSTGIGSTKLLEKATEAASKFNIVLSARCLFEIGRIANLHSEDEIAIAKHEEALTIYRRTGNSLGGANCIFGLGDVAVSRSDYETAAAKYEEALSIYRRSGESLGEANCIARLGDVASGRSDYETATAKYEEALSIFRRIGGYLGEANCIAGLGDVALGRSDYETATAKYEEALSIFRRIGGALGEANCIVGRGNVAQDRSDYETATAKYEEALQIFRRIGDRQGEANCFHGFGKISLSRSDYELATERFNQALAIYRKIGSLRGEAECLFDMGRIAFAQKDHLTARSYFEQALALSQQVDNPLWLSKIHRKLAKLADDETERTAHLELAHRYQERLATIDQMLLLEKEAKGED